MPPILIGFCDIVLCELPNGFELKVRGGHESR